MKSAFEESRYIHSRKKLCIKPLAEKEIFSFNDALTEPDQRIFSVKPYREVQAKSRHTEVSIRALDVSLKNIISFGVFGCIVLWDEVSSISLKMPVFRTEGISAAAWNHSSTFLAVGGVSGSLCILDVSRNQKIWSSDFEKSVGPIHWNQYVLSVSIQDGAIFHFDPRTRLSVLKVDTPEALTDLKWSVDDRFLASAGKNGDLFLWEGLYNRPIFEYNGAEKIQCLEWNSTNFNFLVSGEGKTEKTIQLWNTLNLQEVKDFSCEKRVKSLAFVSSEQKLVAAFKQDSDLEIWCMKTFKRTEKLLGTRKSNIVHLKKYPNEKALISASNNTISFWKKENEQANTSNESSFAGAYNYSIVK